MSLRLTSSAVALMAFAMPALADVTPDEVWQTWLDYYQASGYTVTEGSRDLAGETLTLKDVKLALDAEGAATAIAITQITLQATGDGKVRTVYEGDMIVTSSSEGNEDVDGFAMQATIKMPGNETVSSGSKEDMTHVMTLPSMTATLDNIEAEGEDMPAMTASVVATNTTATMHSVTGSNAKYDTTMSLEKAEFMLNADGETEGKMALSGVLNDIEANGEVIGFAHMAEAQTNLAAALNKGLVMNGALKAGQWDIAFDFDAPASAEDGTPAQAAKGNASLAGIDLTFAMSKDGLGYQVNSDKTKMELTTSELPMPISYSMDGSSFDVQFPVSQSDTPAPFKLSYSIDGLAFGDAIWDLFDPTKQLPRDPASLDLDVTGTLKVLKDLLDPAVMDASAEMNDEAIADGEDMAEYTPEPTPIEPVEVTINQFAVSAVGAKLSASGTLKPSEDGSMETPVGTINARYEGVNGLLDKLGAMGLVPQDQLGGIRMMMAMFARPGDGEDVLTTDLEFKDDGSVFANGQQVK